MAACDLRARATDQLKSYSFLPCSVRTPVYGCEEAKSLGWRVPQSWLEKRVNDRRETLVRRIKDDFGGK